MTKKAIAFCKTRFDEFITTQTAGQLQDSDNLIAGAYAVQDDLEKFHARQGTVQIGYKVGCISETIQQSLGIYQPILGRLYSTQRWSSGTTFSLSQFHGLAIEGELAVQLSRPISDLQSRCPAPDDLIQSVFPVIELHHYCFDQPPTAADMVAFNAIHAGFVHPEKITTSKQFPEEISIKIDGKEIACVTGAINQKIVFESLSWLATALKQHKLPTHSDQIILCGSAAPLFPLQRVGHVEVTTDIGDAVECIIQE